MKKVSKTKELSTGAKYPVMDSNSLIINAKIFKRVVSFLDKFDSEVGLKITKEHLIMKKMDPSRIGIVEYKINTGDLPRFHFAEEIFISIDPESLNGVLNKVRIGKAYQETAHLTIDTLKDLIYIKVRSRKRRYFVRRFSIPFYETFQSSIKSIDPDDKFTVNLTNLRNRLKNSDSCNSFIINPKILKEIFNDINSFSEIIRIELMKSGIKFDDCRSIVGTPSRVEIFLKKRAIKEWEYKFPCASTYSLTFLMMISNLFSVATSVKFKLIQDHPIYLKLYFEDGSRLKYTLAPRVEEKDFDDEKEEDEF